MATNKRIKEHQEKMMKKYPYSKFKIKCDKDGYTITNKVNGKSVRNEWDNARA